MRYHIAGLLALLLFAASAQAQFITDPARATAARDTLLREAQQLRQRVEQTTRRFSTNARGRSRKRVVVVGEVDPTLAAGVPAPGQPQPVQPRIRWKHVTRYRRNGRVQERFRAWLDNNTLLDERRLNGTVLWLSLPLPYSSPLGVVMRHRGFYLRTGYLVYDKDVYVLPQPAQ
ncbi:hypothetical protein [Hymenobacter sp.]|uniref:hypothetical protein n=1 Tax=Hymenobacter sp. TaxID=1898978 RepID=UPI00286D2787|nr:hypothetical protein [Hymenobacter sp.]